MKKPDEQLAPAMFQQVNVNLRKPDSMTDEECRSLPVYTDGTICISCWRLPWWARLKALLTGKVWLGVLSGHTQPPVWLTTEFPFVKEDKTHEKS